MKNPAPVRNPSSTSAASTPAEETRYPNNRNSIDFVTRDIKRLNIVELDVKPKFCTAVDKISDLADDEPIARVGTTLYRPLVRVKPLVKANDKPHGWFQSSAVPSVCHSFSQRCVLSQYAPKVAFFSTYGVLSQ